MQKEISISPESALIVSDQILELELAAQRLRYQDSIDQIHIDGVNAAVEAGVECEADLLPKEDKSLSNTEKRTARVRQILSDVTDYNDAVQRIRDRKEKLAYNTSQTKHALRMYETIQSFAHLTTPDFERSVVLPEAVQQ